MPKETPRVRYRSAQRDRLAIAGDDRIDAHNVAVNQWCRKAGSVGFQRESAALRMALNALHRDVLAG